MERYSRHVFGSRAKGKFWKLRLPVFAIPWHMLISKDIYIYTYIYIYCLKKNSDSSKKTLTWICMSPGTLDLPTKNIKSLKYYYLPIPPPSYHHPNPLPQSDACNLFQLPKRHQRRHPKFPRGQRPVLSRKKPLKTIENVWCFTIESNPHEI